MKKFKTSLFPAIIFFLIVTGAGLNAENPCQKECTAVLDECIRDCQSLAKSGREVNKQDPVKAAREKKLCSKKCYSNRRDCWRQCDR